MSTTFPAALGRPLSRRRFVQGLALTGAALGMGWPRAGQAATVQSELRGTEFDLVIGEQGVNLTGRDRRAITVNGTLPAPLLRMREGDTVTVRVRNTLAEDSSIHWHGLILPANMDGVPGLSFNGIRPGETFVYRFPLKQSGTYWYHSHSSMQEAQGLYGPLVIEPREPDPVPYDREHVLLLSDWSDMAPQQILANLRKAPTYYNFHQRTVGDLWRDIRDDGLQATLADRLMWGRMRMTPTDLADVSGYTYTYLVNGRPPAANWTGLFRPGERVRLRFINAAAMTYFDVRIPGLTMTVVAADGLPVEPVAVDEFRLGVAETLDVIVTPEAEAYTVFAQSMDRTGFARATLALREGLAAPVPALDARPLLTMVDMGHGGHGGGAPGAEHGDGHAGREAAGHGADHSAHAGPGSHDGHGSARPVGGAGMSPAMPEPGAHAGHGEARGAGQAGAQPAPAQRHPATEAGNPGVDMQAEHPMPRLADPGVGLRDNGRRVLTYADLKSAFPDPDGRAPTREIELHLTGHMDRYVWSFDGVPFSEAAPIELKYGERVRITLVNDTMMEHPIHLHGMWSDLEDEQGNFLVRKHTISMPPGTRRSYRVTADALGRWAYHCHLLMHMDLGMFREVRVLP